VAIRKVDRVLFDTSSQKVRSCIFLFGLSLISCFPVIASDFQQPTQEELKMTSDPAAPGAEAVYLFIQQVDDNSLHTYTVYARIKILTEKGKEYGDVELPMYEKGEDSFREIKGRTIHSDGTVIPFSGKPIEKLVLKQGDEKVMTKVFSLPDVQVGSIVEYQYQMLYSDFVVRPAKWYVQRPLYVHKGHYHFVPANIPGVMYVPVLPPGAQVRKEGFGYDMVVENVPPVIDEEYMPPMKSLSYRVLFYYSSYLSDYDFWTTNGKDWSEAVDRFAKPSGKLKAAVQQIVAPGDTDEQKVRKIYAAIMQLENASFSREHTAAENKAEKIKIKSADDIWELKRGNDGELTRLFIAMLRASGMKAYAMIVANRERGFLVKNYPEWGQLDDEIAIVPLNGKEMFFDPGERYCEFGKLHWDHASAGGVRQVDGGTTMGASGSVAYKDTQIARYAELKLDSDYKLQGQIRMTLSGSEALHWRQHILLTDEEQAKKDFEDALQKDMPAGVVVKTNHFIGVTDYDHTFMVVLDVSGQMGTATGKRIIIPGTFFEANAKPLFALEKRESPVELHFPYVVSDSVTLTLPPGFTVESVPKDAEIPLPDFANYSAKYKGTDTAYGYSRRMILANVLYSRNEYPQLKDFYAKANAQDQQQVVLHAVAAPGKGQ
jgi:hypothetical protein